MWFKLMLRGLSDNLALYSSEQEGITWERPDTRFFGQKQKQTELGQKLQGMETPLRGMELALGSCSSFPVHLRREELTHSLESSREQIAHESSILPDSVSALKTKEECTGKLQWHLEVGSLSPPDLSVCFFWYCMELFRGDLLPLLPWIVFTGFLRHSRMYGQAGGISAAIGAVLILGRRNYRDPTEFAIARIVEVSIGLLCFIFAELLFNPARAATLAKTELSNCLDALLDCIQSLILCSEQENETVSVLKELRKKQAKLKNHVDALENFIAEAVLEPNFWFSPFNATCYKELLGSFSKITDLCLYASDELTNLSRVQQIFGFAWEELQDHITHDLKAFKEKLESSAKFFEENISTNSLARFQRELQKRKICQDIEAGKQPNSHSRMGRMGPDQEEVERFSSSFLLLLKEVADKISSSKAEEVLKSKTVLCLSSLGFCISKLMQETIAIKTGVFQIT